MTENKQAATVVPAYLRLQEAADYIRMSQPGLQRLHRLGEGPPRIKKGRAVFYPVRMLDAWMLKDLVRPATGTASTEVH
jgi:hypothetical protein